MNKITIGLTLAAFALIAIMAGSIPFIGQSDATEDLTAEVLYSDGIVTITGQCPSETVIVDLTLIDKDGKEYYGYAKPSNCSFLCIIRAELDDDANLIISAQKFNVDPIVITKTVEGKPKSIDVSSVTVNQSDKDVSLYVGEKRTVRAEVSPSNATDPTITWSSDKPGIATVDESTGEITAVSAGDAVITATAGGKTDTVDVKVYSRPATDPTFTFKLSIDFHTSDLKFGSSGYDINALKRGITLKAQGKDAGSALEKALNDNGIPNSFFDGDSGNQSLQHWVDQIFGMGDVHYDNGVWLYWIQYHNGSYNQMTLGYYKEGGSFELVYGMTFVPEDSSSNVNRIRSVELPNVTRTYTGSTITGLSDTSAYTVVSGGTGKDVGSYDAVLRLKEGYAWEDATFTDKSVRWFIEEYTEEADVVNPDGSHTSTTTKTDDNGTTVIEVTTNTSKDKDGNVTDSKETTTTNKDKDGNVTGSTEVNEVVKTDKNGNVLESTTTKINKDKDGNVTDSKETVTATASIIGDNGNVSDVTTVTETNKDGNGNVTGSSEMSETKDKDGNLTAKSEVVKDKDGNETYSKLEEYVPESTRIEEGNTITESSNRVTEKKSGKTTVVSESVVEIVKSDGQTEKETVREESVTGTDGKTETAKVTENVKDDLDGDIIKSTQTETKDADGKESTEKKVEAESKDGNVTSSVEIPNDSEKVEIVTVVKTDSEGGSHTVSAEQIQQAVSIQEKVSDAIFEDVKEQIKVIQVESETVDASMTVSQDAVRAVSDSGSELKMVSQEGSMQISKEILENLSDVEDVTISFSKSEDAVKEKMTDAQKEAVDENATVLELKITSGDTSLGDRLGGTLTVTVKHKQAEGMVAVAYYIADDGTKEKLNGTYDPEKEEMSFETTHCSIYAIVDESSEPEPVPEPIVDPDEPSSGDKDDGMMLYIGIAIAVIAAIAVAGVLYMRKN